MTDLERYLARNLAQLNADIADQKQDVERINTPEYSVEERAKADYDLWYWSGQQDAVIAGIKALQRNDELAEWIEQEFTTIEEHRDNPDNPAVAWDDGSESGLWTVWDDGYESGLWVIRNHLNGRDGYIRIRPETLALSDDELTAIVTAAVADGTK